MAGNPVDSKWRATPRALRNRKPLSVTLSDGARAKLERLAAKADLTLSAAVEALVTSTEAGSILTQAATHARHLRETGTTTKTK